MTGPLRLKRDGNPFFSWRGWLFSRQPCRAIMKGTVHTLFRLETPICVMAKFGAKLLLIGLCGFFSLGSGAAWADGFRFGGYGGWGPRFGGPYFGGPRYDGPRYYDVEPDPAGPAPDERVRAMDPRPPGPRACYSSAETRERVISQNLREPFALMRKASAFAHAEALSGKLCRWKDLDIYEITLLRPDGRVVHVFLNAATGAVVGALNTH